MAETTSQSDDKTLQGEKTENSKAASNPDIDKGVKEEHLSKQEERVGGVTKTEGVGKDAANALPLQPSVPAENAPAKGSPAQSINNTKMDDPQKSPVRTEGQNQSDKPVLPQSDKHLSDGTDHPKASQKTNNPKSEAKLLPSSKSGSRAVSRNAPSEIAGTKSKSRSVSRSKEVADPHLGLVSSQSKAESMSEDDARLILQRFMKNKLAKNSQPAAEETKAKTPSITAEKSSSKPDEPKEPAVPQSEEQIDQLVDRIVHKLKPFLNPTALEAIEEKDEREQSDDDLAGIPNPAANELDTARTPSMKTIQTAEKVQHVLEEVEKLRNLIDVKRSLSRANDSQEKELTSVILAMKRKEAKITAELKELAQKEAVLESQKEIMTQKEEEIETYVRELVENTKKNDERREALRDKERDIDKQLADAEDVTRDCKEREERISEKERELKNKEVDLKERAAEIERRERQIENEKRTITDQKEKTRAREDKNKRREREQKNEEQRNKEFENELKMQEMDVKFRMEEVKRKEEEMKRKMDEVEEENDKLDKASRKLQSERRRLNDDFLNKQEELNELGSRIKRTMGSWNRKQADKPRNENGFGKSLESTITEVESERRLLELEAELVEQQLELERKGRLILQQDKALAELGRPQPNGNGLSRRKEDTRFPPLANKSPQNASVERSGRIENSNGFQKGGRGTHQTQSDRPDSLTVESIMSDEDSFDDFEEMEAASNRSKQQSSNVFKFSLISIGSHSPEVSFKATAIKTIRELKMALKNKEGIPVSWQKFYSDARPLSDSTKLHGMSGKTQLRITMGRGNKSLRVIIPGGDDIKLSFDVKESFHIAKVRIFQMTGLLPSRMRLYLAGREMKSRDVLGNSLTGRVTEMIVAYDEY